MKLFAYGTLNWPFCLIIRCVASVNLRLIIFWRSSHYTRYEQYIIHGLLHVKQQLMPYANNAFTDQTASAHSDQRICYSPSRKNDSHTTFKVGLFLSWLWSCVQVFWWHNYKRLNIVRASDIHLSSADNICKQFVPRLVRTPVLICSTLWWNSWKMLFLKH